MLVPSPAFRSMALGIMISVIFVLGGDADPAAGRSGQARATRQQARSALGALRRAPLARASPAGASCCGVGRSSSASLALIVLVGLAIPVLSLKTGMPSIKVVPKNDPSRVGYRQVSAAFGVGVPSRLQVIVTPRSTRARPRGVAGARPGDRGGAGSRSPLAGGRACSIRAVPHGPADDRRGREHRRSAARGASRQGAPRRSRGREPTTSKRALSRRPPLVIGVVLALGFLLLLIALRAPLIAAIGAVANLLVDRGGVRSRPLIFQDGRSERPARVRVAGLPGRVGADLLLRHDLRDRDGLHGLPALLRARALGGVEATRTRGRWSRGSPHSGRVILAAGAVMVAVFFTFALSGPMPPKEMGVILAMAVLLAGTSASDGGVNSNSRQAAGGLVAVDDADALRQLLAQLPRILHPVVCVAGRRVKGLPMVLAERL